MESHPSNSIIDTILNFSSLVAGNGDPKSIFSLLTRAAIEHTNADAALVLIVKKDTLIAAESIGLDNNVRALTFDCGAGWKSISAAYASESQNKFQEIFPFPLIDAGDLFGYLVLFYNTSRNLSKWQLPLAEAMAQMSAAILKKDVQYQKLKSAYDELKTSREILSRNEKLNYLGQVTASIIHDLKNILAPLSIQAELVKRCANDNPKVNVYVEKMKATVNRGIAVVDRFRVFSKLSDSEELEESCLNNLIEEAIEIAQPRINSQNKQIEFILDLAILPSLIINPNDFVSVIVNLISNAIDASPEKATIFIRSEASAEGIKIEIRDTGCGMTKEAMDHLFEPFFTTKGKQGTGLGLSGAQSFAKKNRGRLRVYSEVGQGTRIVIYLPYPKVQAQKTPAQMMI